MFKDGNFVEDEDEEQVLRLFWKIVNDFQLVGIQYFKLVGKDVDVVEFFIIKIQVFVMVMFEIGLVYMI